MFSSMLSLMHNMWKPYLESEINKPYFQALKKKLAQSDHIIYPAHENIFTAFAIPPQEVKVVILGQDPYHGPNQAHGLSFSVLPGIDVPPSLRNIYKEIQAEFAISMNYKNGYLMPWVQQGVLLLNSVMTVEACKAASHKGWGWEIFTDNVIKTLSQEFNHIVFMLWGNYAKQKEVLIDKGRHCILQSAPPSPLSAHNGFLGNNHFKLANDYLVNNNLPPIDWKIS